MQSGAVSSGKTFIQILRWYEHIYSVPNNSLLLMSGKTGESLYDNIIRELVALNPRDIIYRRQPQRLLVRSKSIEIACADASNEASYGKIQGKTVYGWLADEITRHPKSFTNMAISRCRGDGKLWPKFWTCNPEHSEHYVLREFIENEALDLKLWDFTFEDNPVLSPEYKAELRNSFTGVFYDRYILGKWVNAEGVVYPDFMVETHVIPERKPPEGARILRSIDFGYKNPFVCIWGYLDEDDRLIIFDVHYEKEKLLKHHAERIKYRNEFFAENNNLSLNTVSDHDAQDRAELHQEGIYTKAAKKDVIVGIQKVSKRLKLQGDGRPRLYITENCKEVIREFKTYEWEEAKEGRAEKEEPKKINDHAMDAIRYMVMEVDGNYSGVAMIRGV